MESNSVCNHTSDKQNRTTAKRESDLLITVSEKMKNNQVTKKGESLHWNTDKGGVNILKLLAKTQKQAPAHAHVIPTLNVIGWFNLHLWLWLAYNKLWLADNKLSNN